MQIPETMSAVLLTGHGGPEKLEYRDDVPVPVAGEHEVLVKVGACGINNTDIWVREGAYGSRKDPEEVSSFGESPLRFPRIQGADIVGTVAAVGSGADASLRGRRVMVDGQPAIAEMERYCKNAFDVKRIWLDVFEGNDIGIHIYEKMGYRYFKQERFDGRRLYFYEKIFDGFERGATP